MPVSSLALSRGIGILKSSIRKNASIIFLELFVTSAKQKWTVFQGKLILNDILARISIYKLVCKLPIETDLADVFDKSLLKG
jgi:hypothetical protein